MNGNRKLYIRLLVAAAVIMVLMGGIWFARAPIVSAVKEWRAASLVSRAEAAAEERKSREAMQLAMAAWQLGPKKIDTLRHLMIHGRAVGLPELSAITLVVFFHDNHDEADRIDILKWTLDRGDPAFFDQLYPNLEESFRNNPEVRLLNARKLGLQGRTLEAIEEAHALEGNEKLAAEVSLLLANLLPRLPGNPVAAKQAAERLRILLDNDDETIALRAWRTLPLLPQQFRDPGLAFDPDVWISAHAGATGADKVFARRLLVGRMPAAEQGEAMEKLAADMLDDPEAVSWIVRWFLETGNGERLLALPEKAFLADSAIFSSRLQVLLEIEKFAEAEAWLGRAPKDFPESVSGSLRAVFARRAGRSSEALSEWRRVIDRASSLQIYGDCVSALKIAERFGEEKAVADVVAVIVSLPSNRLPSSEHLEFLESHFVTRVNDWLGFWRGIVRSRPGDGFAAEQVAFLELLHPDEVDPEVILERTGKLLTRFPAAPRFRATHALWLLSEKRDREALDLLREADVNWNEADSAARAVYVIALRRTGALDEAAALESGLKWDGVGPIRRSILITFLNSQKEPLKS